MELLGEKLLATFLIVGISLIFGFLPLILAKKYDFSSIDTTQPLLMKKQKKNIKNVVLSFLLNIGGGVLLANSFCHLLPEVREGLEGIDSFLPLAEVIMICGFFFIASLEEILHHFLHPHRSGEERETQENYGTVGKQEEESRKETEHEKTSAQVKAALRTAFVVLAVSFHSMVEGLTLSLETESSGVWLNAGATAMHKFVISFCIGVECISNKSSLRTYSVSTVTFSFAAAIGSILGIILTEVTFDSSTMDITLQVLTGIATGTILYVIFFEIFPKAKEVGGTGTQHILAMMLGVAIFLPSLYFHSVGHSHGHGHEHHEEEEEEEGRQVNGYFSISMKPQRPGAFLYKLDVRTAFCWRVGRVLMPTSARLSLHS